MPKPTFSQPYYRNEIWPIFNNRVALHTRYGDLLTVREARDWLNVNQIQNDQPSLVLRPDYAFFPFLAKALGGS